MRHRDAVDVLPDAGTGLLDAPTEAALAAHVEGCPECRDWLATRDLLAEGLAPSSSPAEDHPDSELLALCVVRPEEVRELDRAELRRHLATCRACHEIVERTRRAVEAGRPGSDREARPAETGPAFARHGVRLLAATLGILLLGAGLFAAGLLLKGSGNGSASDGHSTTAASEATADGGSVRSVSGQDLDGTQTIDGTRRLVVSKLTVKTGADVTFNAGEGVSFGDGFRIARGARVTVGAGRAGPEALRGRSAEPDPRESRSRDVPPSQ